jgi:hypothetical protein
LVEATKGAPEKFEYTFPEEEQIRFSNTDKGLLKKIGVEKKE